jgi:hypothetical protein
MVGNMVSRRAALLGTVALLAIEAPRPSQAFLPVILAALAAVVALAVATGKAADALEAVVKKGESLWDTVTSLPDREAARRLLASDQERLREELGVRREVIREANRSQSANSAFVTSVRYYLATRDSSKWNVVIVSINNAGEALVRTAGIFRDKAFYFPPAAQDGLAELPKLYESREGILTQLKNLSASEPPTKDDELNAWSRLVDAYDDLRVKSLKLITALVNYTRAAL